MANKRTVKKRPSNSIKGKNTRSSFLRGEILAIGSACIGIFLIVSIWFGGGGLVGSGITYFLKGVFGDIAFLIPVFVVAVAAILWVMRSQAAGFKLVVLTLSLFELSVLKHYMYRVGNPEIPNGIQGLFYAGTNGVGGGVAGGMIAEPLMALLGNMGSLLFLIAIFLVLIVLLFEISVTKLMISGFQKIKGSLREFAMSVKEYGEEDRPQLPELDEEPTPRKKKKQQEDAVEIELYDWQKAKEEIVIHDPLSQMQRAEQSPVKKEKKKVENLVEKAPVQQEPEEPSVQPQKEENPPSIQEVAEQIQEEMKKPPKKEYVYPFPELLSIGKQSVAGNSVQQLKENAQKLVEILASFGIEVKVTNITRGSSITRYEILPAAGVKVNKITALDQDIALRLPADNVRIEVLAGSIAIEVTNESVSAVYLRGLIEGREFTGHKSKLAVALGKDINGDNVVIDIAKTPHLLIAGQTGSGKSVCINTIITSILYKASPDEVKLVMVDPKVVELGMYNGIPHLLVPIVTDPRKAAGALCWAVNEMEERYQAFAEKSVRDLTGYNHKREEEGLDKLPQIVIIIDELADLMMVAPGEVQDYICRLAQKARAAGMHLVLATQRPSVDVITGIIKANIPSRISFAVSSQIDSRTILDHSGAEKLVGKGDMLLMMNGVSKLRRVQGAFVSDEDIEHLVGFVKEQTDGVEYNEDILNSIESGSVKETKKSGDNGGGGEDELLSAAAEIAFEMNQISASMLQRRLKVGYARAGRLVDLLESKHVISPYDGSNKPRTVIMGKAEFDAMMEKE